MASSITAEAALSLLRKLPENKKCATCDAESKFGHQNVCEKFKIFVCSNCKSAHQSFSMRVKSVTMSNWSDDEVSQLEAKNGGGNDYGRRVWLAFWDESQMRKPQKGDPLDYYKEFVKAVYLDKRFYNEKSTTFSTSESIKIRKHSKEFNGKKAQTEHNKEKRFEDAGNLLDFDHPLPTSASTTTAFDAFEIMDVSSGSNEAIDHFGFNSVKKSSPNLLSPNDEWGAFNESGSRLGECSTAKPSGSEDWSAFTAESVPPPMKSFGSILDSTNATFDSHTNDTFSLKGLQFGVPQQDFAVNAKMKTDPFASLTGTPCMPPFGVKMHSVMQNSMPSHSFDQISSKSANISNFMSLVDNSNMNHNGSQKTSSARSQSFGRSNVGMPRSDIMGATQGMPGSIPWPTSTVISASTGTPHAKSSSNTQPLFHGNVSVPPSYKTIPAPSVGTSRHGATSSSNSSTTTKKDPFADLAYF